MGNSLSQQDNNAAVDLTAEFQDYAKSLGKVDLYDSNFTFRRNEAKRLTKDEFEEMMDQYQIPETHRYGSKASSVLTERKESGSFEKTILIFARSKKKRYDVVVAEGKLSTSFDWERTGIAACLLATISGAACYMIDPYLGITAGFIGLLKMAGKMISGPGNQEFQDVVTNFMIKQLMAAQDLAVNKQGKFAFVHGRRHTLLDDTSDIIPESNQVPDPINLKADRGTHHSSCCIGCFSFKRQKTNSNH